MVYFERIYICMLPHTHEPKIGPVCAYTHFYIHTPYTYLTNFYISCVYMEFVSLNFNAYVDAHVNLKHLHAIALTKNHCMSDGSLGSLHRWRSQRIAKCWSCELQDTLAQLFLGCGTPYSLNVYIASQINLSCFITRKDCSALGWECPFSHEIHILP